MSENGKISYEFSDHFNSKLLVAVVSGTGCHEVVSHSTDTNGYPQIRIDTKKRHASRWIYEFHYGPIAKGMSVLHRCDNRKCINPKHLFLGTQLDNIRDMIIKNRMARGSRRGKAKLTEEQVFVIKKLIGRKRQCDIARMFGVTYQTIQAIEQNRVWKHVVV